MLISLFKKHEKSKYLHLSFRFQCIFYYSPMDYLIKRQISKNDELHLDLFYSQTLMHCIQRAHSRDENINIINWMKGSVIYQSIKGSFFRFECNFFESLRPLLKPRRLLRNKCLPISKSIHQPTQLSV